MSLIAAIGWLGNACFLSRSLLQWVLSERVGRCTSPRAYWRLSLLGSACLAAYAIDERQYVLLVGFAINGAIYVRNLALQGPRSARPRYIVALACSAGGLLLSAALCHLRLDAGTAPVWLLCAVAGQAVWSSRFVVQWQASERRGTSHFPPMFWWVSLAGNALLLAYALHLRDPVLIAGYALGPILQVRNLVLCHRLEPAAVAP